MNAAPILQTVDLKKHYQQGEHRTAISTADWRSISFRAGWNERRRSTLASSFKQGD